MNKKRVPTGVPDLDAVIEGGFPGGKSYLVTGEPGTGKSIFCIQFILKGLMEGEKAVYVAVDQKPTDILEQAASLGWDLAKYADQKQLLILDASPYFSARMGTAKEKEVDVQKTVADLASYVTKMNASRVVIDPVGPLIVSRDTTRHVQDYVRLLVHSLQENMESTNLLTSYTFPGKGGVTEQGVEEFLVAGVIILKLIRMQNRFARTLLISKMRGTAFDMMEYQFNIARDKGIALKPII